MIENRLFLASSRTCIELPHPLLIHNKHQYKGPFDSKIAAMHAPFMWLFVPKILFKYSGPIKQRTNGHVNPHLIAGPSISTKHAKPILKMAEPNLDLDYSYFFIYSFSLLY